MVQTDGIKFVDTTIRDGHQSLWAENMTTGMMLPVAEAPGPRRLRRDRIDLQLASEKMRARAQRGSLGAGQVDARTHAAHAAALERRPVQRLRYHAALHVPAFHGANGGQRHPRSAHFRRVERTAKAGTWKTKVSRDVGINPVLNIIYSVSPKHTDEYFAERTRQAASLKVNRLCLKDPGGLLTPERLQTLVPIMFANANGIPIELHTHCTTGLGPLCCLEAVKLGIKIVNTALPPLADGSSNPVAFQRRKKSPRPWLQDR